MRGDPAFFLKNEVNLERSDGYCTSMIIGEFFLDRERLEWIWLRTERLRVRNCLGGDGSKGMFLEDRWCELVVCIMD